MAERAERLESGCVTLFASVFDLAVSQDRSSCPAAFVQQWWVSPHKRRKRWREQKKDAGRSQRTENKGGNKREAGLILKMEITVKTEENKRRAQPQLLRRG